MNKAEAIEKLESMGFTTMKTAVDIINAIQPTVDEALKVLGENYQMTSEQYEEIWGKGMDYGMADRLIKEKTGRSLWEHIHDNFADFNKPQKVVIPKFVAEYLDSHFGDAVPDKWDRADLIRNYEQYIEVYGTNELSDWISNTNNFILFVEAVLHDYEVEKEKLYRVEFPGMHPNDVKHYWIRNGEYIGLQNTHDGRKSDDCRFTEQEIKSIDERYFAFAAEVEDSE